MLGNQPRKPGSAWRCPALLALLALGALAAAGCAPSDPVERRETIYRLQADPTEANVEKLRGLLADPDRDVRANALNVLVGLEVTDADGLALAGLGDEDGFVRATAAKLLGDQGAEAFAEPLAAVLDGDSDPTARQRAAESLARIGGPRALDALAGALADPMEAVRRACVSGLRQLDPCYARSGLARLLIEDATWEVRAGAARTLGLCEDPEVGAMLHAALDDPNEFVRSAAANAQRVHARLGEAGDGGE